MIPEVIKAALKQKRPLRARADRDVRAGDVRLVTAGVLGRRLALVLYVDISTDSAEITLVHPYVEYATDLDIVIPGTTTQLSYEIVVQTDIRASVWLVDLRRLVCEVPLDVVEACFEGTEGFEASDDAFLGEPLIGPLDGALALQGGRGAASSEVGSAMRCGATRRRSVLAAGDRRSLRSAHRPSTRR